MKAMCSVLSTAALAMLLGGCLGGSNNQSFADGYYRFVHVSPGTDAVTITANGTSIVPSLNYRAAAPYVQLAWGTPTIKVQSASTGASYVSGVVPVAGNAHYTYYLFGTGASLLGLPLREDVADAASGNFNLRAVHVATGMGALDIYLLAPGASVVGSTPVFSGTAYATSSAYTQFTAGTYDLVVTLAGSTAVIYDSGALPFQVNRKVSFAIFATGSGTLVNAAVLLDDGSGALTFVDNPVARFKFAGATTDVQTVDVLIDDATVLPGVAYGSVSGYTPIAAGNRNIKIQASNTPGAYLYDQTQKVNGGTDNSLAAYSIQGASAVGVFALPDSNFQPSSGKARLRIVNAGSDSTAYDTYVNSSKLLSGIAQGTASAYQELDGATYALSFSPTGTTTVAATLSAALTAGHVYTIYTYGRSGSVAAVLTNDY